MMKKNVISLTLAATMLAGTVSTAAAAPVGADAQHSYVCMTVEAYNVGQGYLLEPTLVDYTEGMTVQDLFIQVTGEAGLDSVGAADGYVTGIEHTDWTEVVFPSYLDAYASELDAAQHGTEMLGIGDFSTYGGWMDTVNNQMDPVGMSSYVLEPGDTVRWVYSVYGWGTDLGVASDWFTPLYTEADKSDLIYELAYADQICGVSTEDAAYTAALEVAGDWQSTEADVEAALNNLYLAEGNYTLADYTDVPEDWSRAGISYVVSHGLMNGMGEHTFAPTATMSRAMLATVLYRMCGEPDVTEPSSFTDVAEGEWYADAIAWAEDNAIVNGVEPGRYNPSGDVTREQMSTIFYRFLTAMGVDTSARSDLSGYVDDDKVSDYAVTAMRWAVNTGVVRGVAEDQLAPASGATRGQTATILMRLLNLKLEEGTLEKTSYTAAADYIQATVNPTYSSVGGEWSVIALNQGGYAGAPAFSDRYYAALERAVQDCQGVLSSTRYTEYARVVLALSAMGKDPTDVAGYDLVTPLTDYDAVMRQGLNGAVYALMALCSGTDAYGTPELRAQYVDAVLERQLADGGWAFTGEVGDADMTAMAVQALSSDLADAQVTAAVERALTCLSALQQADGGYASGTESTAQVILALCAANVTLDDSRFVKGEHSLLDALLDAQLSDGSFCHTVDADSNLMTTEQALCALAALVQA